jgi:hypothetical protein
MMLELRRSLFLLTTALGLAAAAAGCSAAGTDDAPVTPLQNEVHRAPDNDTLFPAVGQLRNANTGNSFCSGTLIGPRTVLTASHCFHEVAQGCTDPIQSIDTNVFALSRAGNNSDVVLYRIDDIRVAPGAYLNIGSCPAGGVETCATRPTFTEFGLNSTDDMIALHLDVAPGQPEPRSIASPLNVLTGIDLPAQLGPNGIVHATLDTKQDFGSGARAAANVVGWGWSDDGITSRRSGVMRFTHDDFWAARCDAQDTCNGTTAATCDRTAGTLLGAIDVFAIPPLWTSVAPGDSGSPLIVTGGTGPGQVPELPGGVSFVMGVLSRGDQTPNGVTPPAGVERIGIYANLTTPSSRQWIETVLAVFGSPTYQPPAWPSLGTWIQGGDFSTPTDGSIAVVRSSANGGGLELFGIGGDNGLYYKSLTASGWTGWQSPSDRGWISKLAAASIGHGVEVFGIGGGPQHLYWRERAANGTWNAWSEHSDFAIADLAAVEESASAATVFAVNADTHEVLARRFAPPIFGGGAPSWSAWKLLGGLGCSASQLSATSANGRLEVLALCTNGQVKHLGEQISFGTVPASHSWPSAWEDVSTGAAVRQVIAAHSASSAKGERLVIVALEQNGRAWVRFRSSSAQGSGFDGWQGLPFGAATNLQAIAATNNLDGGSGVAGKGRLEIFATDARRAVTHVWQADGNDDASWTGLGLRGGPATQLLATFNGDGRIEVFGMSGHAVVHDWQIFVPNAIHWQF